jgi:hypothetical protein
MLLISIFGTGNGTQGLMHVEPNPQPRNQSLQERGWLLFREGGLEVRCEDGLTGSLPAYSPLTLAVGRSF